MRKLIVLASKNIVDVITRIRSPLKVVYPAVPDTPTINSEQIIQAKDLVKQSGVRLDFDNPRKKFAFPEGVHSPLLMEAFVYRNPAEIEMEDKNPCLVFTIDSSVTTNTFSTALIGRTNDGRFCFARMFNAAPYSFHQTGISLSSSHLYELEGIEKGLLEGIRLGYHKFDVLVANDCKHGLWMYYERRGYLKKQGLSTEKVASDSLEIAVDKVILRIDELSKRYKSITIGRAKRLKTTVDELSNYGSNRLLWKLQMCADKFRQEEIRFPVHRDELLREVFEDDEPKGKGQGGKGQGGKGKGKGGKGKGKGGN